MSAVSFRAVIFDWRGTLVVAPTVHNLAAQALDRLGRSSSHAGEVAGAILAANELDAPGIDSDADLHHVIALCTPAAPVAAT
jgi:phosphoglycolate phosphatase-like HAD superfamily hydrolase